MATRGIPKQSDAPATATVSLAYSALNMTAYLNAEGAETPRSQRRLNQSLDGLIQKFLADRSEPRRLKTLLRVISLSFISPLAKNGPSLTQIAEHTASDSSATSGSLSSSRRGYRMIVPNTAAINEAMKIAIFAAA